MTGLCERRFSARKEVTGRVSTRMPPPRLHRGGRRRRAGDRSTKASSGTSPSAVDDLPPRIDSDGSASPGSTPSPSKAAPRSRPCCKTPRARASAALAPGQSRHVATVRPARRLLGGAGWQRRAAVVAVGRDLRAIAALQQRLVDAQQSMERDYWRCATSRRAIGCCSRSSSEAVLIVDAATQKVVEANPAARSCSA